MFTIRFCKKIHSYSHIYIAATQCKRCFGVRGASVVGGWITCSVACCQENTHHFSQRYKPSVTEYCCPWFQSDCVRGQISWENMLHQTRNELWLHGWILFFQLDKHDEKYRSSSIPSEMGRKGSWMQLQRLITVIVYLCTNKSVCIVFKIFLLLSQTLTVQ